MRLPSRFRPRPVTFLPVSETPYDQVTPGGSRAGSRAAACAALLLLLAGCGTTGKAPGKPGGGRPVQVEEGADLPRLAKAVKTREDSLVLDLLIGYRMLLLANPEAKDLDPAALKRSRQAYEKLEHALRHGGLRSRDGGERVYSITNAEMLSLQEVLRSASATAAKSAQAGDWEKARARWREILQSKAAVAWTMEEASWGLALADALESGLPDSIKRELRAVDESYARGISQDDIARQVKALLAESIPDDKLRRELKKLANRAWERDKRAGRLTASPPAADTAPPQAAAGAAPAGPAPGQAGTAPGAVPAGSDSGDARVLVKVDSLIAQGKYLPALRALDGSDAAPWARERKTLIGDRYCEEKRKAAAVGFKDFKKAGTDAERGAHLRRTAADLDSCLFYFPDHPVAQKVRRNREMVEAELKKLKP